ncbi:MAG: complex I NDUFA9 subunit family protein [Caldilineae bacterium]|nr:complex I NDUFA9 subunit family protein [Anaerolineae bacterium]MCB9154410.1 complex I NDUFA9 subunit family protein [Caldilineae bacterium]
MIVVTGGSGYIGSYIVWELVKAGEQVRVMVHNTERAKQEGRLAGLPVEWVQGDVTRPETLAAAMQGASAVIHTVAIAIEKGGRTYEEINFTGTVNVVDAAKAAGVQRFLNMCQLGADSSLPYRFLASKGKAQEYVAQSGLDWTAFRPSSVWGPEDEFANSFARLIPLTPVIFPIIGDENARFESVYVGDVAATVVKTLHDPTTMHQEYELGGPEILTLEEIERRTLRALGKKRKLIHMPMGLIRLAVTGMETLLPSPPVTRSLLELLAVPNVTSNNQLRRFVDQPRPFTVENIAPYMRQFEARQTVAQFFNR